MMMTDKDRLHVLSLFGRLGQFVDHLPAVPGHGLSEKGHPRPVHSFGEGGDLLRHVKRHATGLENAKPPGL